MTDRRKELAAVLRERIISGLHLGNVRPGKRLAGTRQVAAEFAVSPRTAMAAYRLLETEGLVELRERSGIYVASSGTGPGSDVMMSQLSRWVVQMLLDARSREVPPIEFPDRVHRCLETLRLRAVCVAGNADHMDQICRELKEDYGILSTALSPEQVSEPDQPAQRALSAADLLVCTSLCAGQVQPVSHRLGKPAMIVRLRAELMQELTRKMEQQPVYIIASDPRFRAGMEAVFAPTGFGANARAVILGEDSLDTIPVDAPTYIMRLAHDKLGDTPLARRVVPIRRVFASDMARDLLTFIVRANMAAMASRV